MTISRTTLATFLFLSGVAFGQDNSALILGKWKVVQFNQTVVTPDTTYISKDTGRIYEFENTKGAITLQIYRDTLYFGGADYCFVTKDTLSFQNPKDFKDCLEDSPDRDSTHCRRQTIYYCSCGNKSCFEYMEYHPDYKIVSLTKTELILYLDSKDKGSHSTETIKLVRLD